jgi:Na+-transporting methylmalonyl-CoA/oxaloacetate decarboxylase gamma subunit
VEGKATLLQEVLDVLQLGVVVVFIFGFLLEGTVELSSTTVDVGSL